MIRHTLYIISLLTFAICSSCSDGPGERIKFHGIPIADEIKTYYSNDSISYHILLFSRTSLDGFWTSSSLKGEKGRTQLYLNGILDTTWYYNDDWPVSHEYSEDHSHIYYVPHDTAQLFHSIREKLKNYLLENAPGFENVTNQKFLDIRIKRKFLTHHRNGDIDRELLLINENNLDGFWLEYDWDGLRESDIVFNHKLDTTLSWTVDRRLMFIGPDENYPDIIVGSVGGRDADSIQIVTSIQRMFNKYQE